MLIDTIRKCVYYLSFGKGLHGLISHINSLLCQKLPSSLHTPLMQKSSFAGGSLPLGFGRTQMGQAWRRGVRVLRVVRVVRAAQIVRVCGLYGVCRLYGWRGLCGRTGHTGCADCAGSPCRFSPPSIRKRTRFRFHRSTSQKQAIFILF